MKILSKTYVKWFKKKLYTSWNWKDYESLSPFWWPFSRWTWISRCLLKQRMMEVVVTTGAISYAKLQSNNHHQQTNIHFLQAGCPSCHPTNSVKAVKGKISHSMDLLTPSSPWGLPTLPLTTNSSWLPLERVAMPLISPLMPVPQKRLWILNRNGNLNDCDQSL